MRQNFNNKKKSEIYVLDKCTCSFTGVSLWIIDHGNDPSYQIDWVDHIVPASNGGTNDVSNGALAAWYPNYRASDSLSKEYICSRGKIIKAQSLSKAKGDRIEKRLNRFSKIVASDWFLNRGIWHVSMAAATKYDAKNGMLWKRDSDYWLAASKKMLNTWIRLNVIGIEDLRERGLIPSRLNRAQEIICDYIESIGTRAENDQLKILLKTFTSAY